MPKGGENHHGPVEIDRARSKTERRRGKITPCAGNRGEGAGNRPRGVVDRPRTREIDRGCHSHRPRVRESGEEKRGRQADLELRFAAARPPASRVWPGAGPASPPALPHLQWSHSRRSSQPVVGLELLPSAVAHPLQVSGLFTTTRRRLWLRLFASRGVDATREKSFWKGNKGTWAQELGTKQFSGMDQRQRLECMFNGVRETYDAAREGLKTNYYGTKNVIEALLPLLQASSDGRIVNVTSEFGLLRLMNNEELRQELNDVEKLTEERLDEVLGAFLRDFEAGEVEARGWPMAFSAYKVSKVAVNAYTRILARKHPELRVNCAHPGYVSTDMTIHTGPLTPQEGAANLVKVALLPEGGVTGAYFAYGQEASFV